MHHITKQALESLAVGLVVVSLSFVSTNTAQAAVNWTGSNDPNAPGDAANVANWGGFNPNGDEWRITSPAGLFVATNMSASAAAASGAFKLGNGGTTTAYAEIRSGGTLGVFGTTMRIGTASGAKGVVRQLDGSAVNVVGGGNSSDLTLGHAAGSDAVYEMFGGLLNVESQIVIGSATVGTFFWTGGTIINTGGNIQRGLTFGNAGVMHIIGTGGTSNISGLIMNAPSRLRYELKGSSTDNANSVTPIRLNGSASFGSYRPGGSLEVKLTAGVALTSNNVYTLITSAEGASTTFASVPTDLWQIGGNVGGSTLLTATVNPASLKGSLDAAIGGSVSFAATSFGHVEINAPNFNTNPLFLMMAVQGDLTSWKMALDDAGYLNTMSDPLLTGDFNMLLTLDPDVQNERFLWDLADFGLTVTAIGVADQPGQAASDGVVPEPAISVLTGLSLLSLMTRSRRTRGG